jgi:hypothetical protein
MNSVCHEIVRNVLSDLIGKACDGRPGRSCVHRHGARRGRLWRNRAVSSVVAPAHVPEGPRIFARVEAAEIFPEEIRVAVEAVAFPAISGEIATGEIDLRRWRAPTTGQALEVQRIN